MKKLITLLLVLTGMVSTASANDYDDYWIVGNIPGAAWDTAADGFKMSTSNGNIYTLTMSLTLEGGANYSFKARNKQNTWDGATSYGNEATGGDKNQIFYVDEDKGGEYNVIFVLNVNEQKVVMFVVNKFQIKGTFDSWEGKDMTSTGEPYTYNYSLDLSSNNSAHNFKFYVDAPGHNWGEDNDGTTDCYWIGPSQIATSNITTWSGALSTNEDNYQLNQNIVKGYKGYEITAKWTPSTSLTSGWSLSITPSVERENVNKVLYENNKDWEHVYAHYYTGENPVASWPGEEITKIGDLYTFFYNVEKNKIIFNKGTNGEGNQTSEFDFVSNAVYNFDGTIGNQTVAFPSGEKYATFSSKYPLTFDDAADAEVKAFKASVGTDVVNFTRVTGVVPANTGLFVQRFNTGLTPSVAPAATATADVSGNLLKPTTGDNIYDNTKAQYVFARQDGQLAFYKVVYELSPAAGKAYLETSSAISGARLGFAIDDEEVTGISQIENGVLKVENYFNLAGQRVAQPTKGLYIVNGKKYIVK